MDEVSYALEEGKEVIPILHIQCVVPFRLRRLQYVDFRRDYREGLETLLKTLPSDSTVRFIPRAGGERIEVRGGLAPQARQILK